MQDNLKFGPEMKMQTAKFVDLFEQGVFKYCRK